MATTRQPAMTTARRPKSIRGVRCYERPDRPTAPFYVQRRINGARETESYANRNDRDRRAGEWRDSARANTLADVPSRAEILDFRAFKAAIGGADWRDVVAGWRAQGSVGTSILVEEMVAKYTASQNAKVQANKLEAGTKKRHLKVADAFAADFKGLRAAELTPVRVVEWLDDFEHDSPQTFNSYLRILRAIWSAAEVTPNLGKKVSFRDATPEEVAILSVADAEKLFAYGLKHVPWLMPRIAVEAFAGLRYSSACRLAEEDVRMADKGILLPAKKLKTGKRTGRRHYIDGLPENLWSWMKLATPATWALTERQYLQHKSNLFSDAGVPHPKNCLRHSACTYHAAAFKDPGKTASMLCHVDQELLWSTYNGRATQADGKRFYSIVASTT